jgi:hypothetical protein
MHTLVIPWFAALAHPMKTFPEAPSSVARNHLVEPVHDRPIFGI